MSRPVEVADAEIVESGMGTLYTAVYGPERGAVEYRWSGFVWEQSFELFRTGTRTVHLLETTAA